EIDWLPVPRATSYDVWIRRLSTNNLQYLGNTSVAATSLDVTDFDIGQYAVVVRARNAQGELCPLRSRIIIEISALPASTSLPLAALPAGPDSLVQVNQLTELTSTQIQTAANVVFGNYRDWGLAPDGNDVSAAWSTSASRSVAGTNTVPSIRSQSEQPAINPLAAELQTSELQTSDEIFSDIFSQEAGLLAEANLNGVLCV
ncbi:MAG: hypothetical protein HQ518_20395, partial [Rhodopirellula sp.]|nr:hypothetical protein [Rhodopirellula sp.]